MRRSNAESSDTFTVKQGFFDRTLALHTDRLGVSCRVQVDALTYAARPAWAEVYRAEVVGLIRVR